MPVAGAEGFLEENREPTAYLSTLSHGVEILVPVDAFSTASAKDIRGPAPVMPLAFEPPARLTVDPPIPEALATGRVFIQYRAENLRIVPVFGQAALAVSPRIGHIHVCIDDLPWHWADAGGELLVITGLPAGPHKILIELVNANHQTLDQKTVSFTVPVQALPAGHL